MSIALYGDKERYDEIIRANQEALNIHIGQTVRVNGKKYTVIEKYPHIIRIQAKDGETMTLNKGDLVQYRARPDKPDKRKYKRAVVCLTDGKRYKSTADLARAMKMTQTTIWRRIENMKPICGKLYRWAE